MTPQTPQCGGARLPRGPKILVIIFLHNSLHAPLALAIGTKKRRAQLVSLRGGGPKIWSYATDHRVCGSRAFFLESWVLVHMCVCMCVRACVHAHVLVAIARSWWVVSSISSRWRWIVAAKHRWSDDNWLHCTWRWTVEYQPHSDTIMMMIYSSSVVIFCWLIRLTLKTLRLSKTLVFIVVAFEFAKVLDKRLRPTTLLKNVNFILSKLSCSWQ